MCLSQLCNKINMYRDQIYTSFNGSQAYAHPYTAIGRVWKEPLNTTWSVTVACSQNSWRYCYVTFAVLGQFSKQGSHVIIFEKFQKASEGMSKECTGGQGLSTCMIWDLSPNWIAFMRASPVTIDGLPSNVIVFSLTVVHLTFIIGWPSPKKRYIKLYCIAPERSNAVIGLTIHEQHLIYPCEKLFSPNRWRLCYKVASLSNISLYWKSRKDIGDSAEHLKSDSFCTTLWQGTFLGQAYKSCSTRCGQVMGKNMDKSSAFSSKFTRNCTDLDACQTYCLRKVNLQGELSQSVAFWKHESMKVLAILNWLKLACESCFKHVEHFQECEFFWGNYLANDDGLSYRSMHASIDRDLEQLILHVSEAVGCECPTKSLNGIGLNETNGQSHIVPLRHGLHIDHGRKSSWRSALLCVLWRPYYCSDDMPALLPRKRFRPR